MLYEMLTGTPPFYDRNKLAIYDKIQHSKPQFYDFHSDSARDLIESLLRKNPEERLCSERGIEELKEHPFFEGYDWDKLL